MTDEKMLFQPQSELLAIQTVPPYQVIDWGVNLVQAPQVWSMTRGENIKVLILDSGLDYRHPDIAKNFRAGRNFTTSNKADYMDRLGHGTHCAGIIAGVDNDIGIVGVAPAAQLYIGKIVNDEGKGSLDWMIAGIQYGIEQEVDIITISIGSKVDPGERLKQKVQQARDAGIIIVAAAGNEAGEVNWPAAYEDVIAVGAFDQAFEYAEFSNYGNTLDVSAPGVDILSTYLEGKYAKLSGTSMATPIVTGVIALLLSSGKKRTLKTDPGLILNLIKERSESVGPFGEQPPERSFGNGMLNVFRLLKRFNEPLL